MDDDYQMFKIIIIGSANTGKTQIAIRYLRNQFSNHPKTVGTEFLTKIVKVRDKNIKLTLWDTAGQQRYSSLSKVYFKGASGVLIVYDVNQPKTYLEVQSQLKLANQNLNLDEVVVTIVGHKMEYDNDRKVPFERAIHDYKEKMGFDCWEVSAETGQNITQLFTQLLDRIYQKQFKIKSSVVQPNGDKNESKITLNEVSKMKEGGKYKKRGCC